MTESPGRVKIDWAAAHMPLRQRLKEELAAERPFDGKRIAMSIHLEAKTACLAMLLRDAGAEVWVTGSNPLSTQDDVAAALDDEAGIFVRAKHGATKQQYDEHLHAVLDAGPDMILDDGGDLVEILHEAPARTILGGCEETTTGVARLRTLDRAGTLRFPMFAVNDARMKYLFDNRYGTGQSSWDGIMRSTNLLVAGKVVLVSGYGWCGRGIAMRASGLGARVTVSEVDPVRAIEAWMDGFSVAAVEEAMKTADFVVTATGCTDVVTENALRNAKDGVILSNAGHFNVEINLEDLRNLSESERAVRPGVDEYTLADGRRIYVLGEGRLVNLAVGDGHPVEIMDISFAIQALTLRHLVETDGLEPGLHSVPAEIDERVARMKLDTLGVKIDRLSAAQRAYLGLEA
jgi:adenosylhomocysteinase